MNKVILLLLISVLSLHILSAQDTIYIPDSNFKNALLSNPSINTTDDGEITTDEALTVDFLDVSSKGISDLTGIKAFTNLETLDCGNNSLTSLDVSGLTNLGILECGNNSLYSIDIRNTPDLFWLYATSNPDLACIVVDDVMNVPNNVWVNQSPVPYTTEPCFDSFEGLSVLLDAAGLSSSAGSVLTGALQWAEKACSSGSKWLAVTFLSTLKGMVTTYGRLGQLSAIESDGIMDAIDGLVASIISGEVDCSSASPDNILDWIASWFGLEDDRSGTAGASGAAFSGSALPAHYRTPSLYPNPTTGRINLSQSVDRVEVYNMVGQLMKRVSAETDHLDIQTFDPGMYVVRMIDDGKTTVERIVKQ